MKSTLLMGFLSRAVVLGGNIILLPLILRGLSSAEYSIWMIFLTTLSLAILLDCGFASVISRYYTYVLSGCKQLPIDELKLHEVDSNCKDVDYSLFTLIYKFTNYLYFSLAILSLTALYFIWEFYLYDLSISKNIDIFLPWSIFSLSIIITLYFNKFNAYFFGIKKVESIYKISMISGFSYIVIAIVLLNKDLGLLGLAISKLISSLLYLAFGLYELKNSNEYKYLNNEKYLFKDYVDIFKRVQVAARNTAIFTFGSFLLNRSSTFFIAKYLPDKDAAGLLLMINLISTITSVTYIYMNTKTPILNTAVYRGRKEDIVSTQNDIFLKSIVFYLISAMSLIVIGDFLLELISSNTRLPSIIVSCLVVFVYTFEVILAISTNFLMSHNNLCYAKYVAYSGLAFVLISYPLIHYFPYAETIILCQLFVQSLYNFWKWPLVVFNKIKNYKSKTV
ncbi:hypothetical protein [Vibrio sp. H11]|uniref:hypothetical protein n=1 Tax=Vibrio sp. H11 TaxID=2565928 RepID=UPI0010A63159|nr:hypothetical protein [Vibrio sp. H11]